MFLPLKMACPYEPNQLLGIYWPLWLSMHQDDARWFYLDLTHTSTQSKWGAVIQMLFCSKNNVTLSESMLKQWMGNPEMLAPTGCIHATRAAVSQMSEVSALHEITQNSWYKFNELYFFKRTVCMM